MLNLAKQVESRGNVLKVPHLEILVARLASSHPKEAVDFFTRMRRLGHRPRGPTLTGAVHALALTGELDTAKELVQSIEKDDEIFKQVDVTGELAAFGALVHGLCRARRLGEAKDVLTRLRSSLPSSSLPQLYRMYESLLLGAGLTNDVDFAWEIYSFLKQEAHTLSAPGLTFLVRALLPTATPGSKRAAQLQAVLQEARDKQNMTAGVWSALLAVECDEKRPLENAEKLYTEMISTFAPNGKWVQSAFKNHVVECKELHAACRHMLRAYAKRGNAERADRVLRDMFQLQLWPLQLEDYTVLLQLARSDPACRCANLAAPLFRMMQSEGLVPDRPAWVQLFDALARGGAVTELQSFWSERMRTEERASDVEHVVFIRGLVRGGAWEAAVKHVKDLGQRLQQQAQYRNDLSFLSPLEACVRASRSPSIPPLSAVVHEMLNEKTRLQPRQVDALMLGLGKERTPAAVSAIAALYARDPRPRASDLLAAAEALAECGDLKGAQDVLSNGLSRHSWRPDGDASLLLQRYPALAFEKLTARLPAVPQLPSFLLLRIQQSTTKRKKGTLTTKPPAIAINGS